MKFELARFRLRLISSTLCALAGFGLGGFGPSGFGPRGLAIGVAHAQDELSAAPPAATDSGAADSGATEPGEKDDGEEGPEFAVRAGYATALGRVERGEPIRNSMAGAVPLWVDVGYRLNQSWFVGVYGHYGLGIDSATSASDCSGCQHTWVRFGAQAQYRWLLDPTRALWVGLGVGRESLNTSIDQRLSSSRSVTGWELLNLQFGSDFRPTTGLSLGPYFSLSFDAYTEKNQRCGDNECPRAERNVTSGLDSSGVHSWVNAGMRVVLLP